MVNAPARWANLLMASPLPPTILATRANLGTKAPPRLEEHDERNRGRVSSTRHTERGGW